VARDTGPQIAIENRVSTGRFLIPGVGVHPWKWFDFCTPLLGIGSLVGITFIFLGSRLVGYYDSELKEGIHRSTSLGGFGRKSVFLIK